MCLPLFWGKAVTKEPDFSVQGNAFSLLRRERATVLEALDLVVSLSHFSSDVIGQPDSVALLREVCARVRGLVSVDAMAVYLPQGENHGFAPVHCEPKDAQAGLDRDLEPLVSDYTFAYVLRTGEPCFFLVENRRTLLLHVISTPTRIRGMFVASLALDKGSVSDTTRKLLSITMAAAAHALESHEATGMFRETAFRLEKMVRQRTEELTATNRQIRKMLHSIQTGVLLIDADSRTIVDVNAAALHMLRATRKDVVGIPCHGTVCFASEEHCPFSNSSAFYANTERTLIAQDGTPVPILESVSELRAGSKRYFVKSFTDLTEQRKLARLKEDMERITRHDLKTPLNGIINLPDLILGMGPVTEQQKELLLHLRQSGLNMLRIINMSLDMYKMEMGTYVYQPARIDILPIIRAVQLDLFALLRAQQVHVSVVVDGKHDTPETRLFWDCEETLFGLLLSNLLTNAAQASPPEHRITVTVQTSVRAISLEVHNFGVVPEAIRKDFFSKYATYGKKDGTGLGTFSAHLIAITMGGEISFFSSETQGTSVTVTWPVGTRALPPGRDDVGLKANGFG